jgi:acyl-CoA reductase-like NAD-dependent aldehyde dehydrogenase
MGAKVLIDGRNATPPEGYENGYWLGATILDGVDPDWPSATDEIFGPVLTIIRADTLEDAMKIENGINMEMQLLCSPHRDKWLKPFQNRPQLA